MHKTPTVPLRRWLIIAALAALSTLATVTVARGAEDFRIDGGGWGHGVGMSQYGAYGMALIDDADAAEILGHYYSGTSLGQFGAGMSVPGPLWVNLISEAESVQFETKAISGGGSDTTVTFGSETLTVAAGGSVTVAAAGSGSCTVTAGATVLGPAPCNVDLSWDGWATTPTTLLQINAVTFDDLPTPIGCTHMDWNASPATARPCQYARGTLHVRPDNDTDAFHTVLEIDIEDYMLGISEMPYWWGDVGGQAALEAQAIAARSYATHRQSDIGDPATRTACWCHVMDSTADQRYVGWGHSGAGQDNWIDAVRDSAGVVVTHPTETKGGALIPIEAFYSSSTFGRTEPSVVGFGRDVPYLQSVDDHWAIDPAAGNPHSTWTRTLGATQMAELLGLAADVTAVTQAACSTSGAASELRFELADGSSTTVLSRHLRTPLGLRSTQITGVNDTGFCANAAATPPPTTTTTTAPPPETTTTTTTAPPPGQPAIDAIIVDDNATGDSVGNDDAVAQCGETVELDVRLLNGGAGLLEAVAATLTVDSAHIALLHNTTSDYPNMAAESTAVNDNDWDLVIASATPDGHTVGLSLDVTASGGESWTLRGEIVIRCEAATVQPPPTLAGVIVDDGVFGDSVGNGDAVAQCGEIVELYVDIHNPGQDPLTGVVAELRGDVLYNTTSGYADVAGAGESRNTNDWDFSVGSSDLSFTLSVTADQGGPWELAVTVPVDCATDLAIANVTVDDGVFGDSVGNNDKIAQCGETVELYVAVTGPDGAQVSAELVTAPPGLTVLYNRTATYPALDAAVAQDNINDWDLEIADDAGPLATLVFAFTSNDGTSWSRSLDLPVACDVLSLGAVTVDDGVFGDSIGNNDAVAQCGETIELYLELRNRASQTLTDVTATLAAPSGAQIRYNTVSAYPDLAPGASGENEGDWDIAIPAGAPATLEFTLTVATGDAVQVLSVPLPVTC